MEAIQELLASISKYLPLTLYSQNILELVAVGEDEKRYAGTIRGLPRQGA